jgi:hypothetical protein
MKRYKYLAIIALCFGAMSLQSCLDFDEPTDDFRPEDIDIKEEVLAGTPDHIDYKAEFTEVQVDSAAKKLNNYFGMMKTAQYYMRGGKDGNPPVSHAYQRHYTLSDVYAQYSVVPHQDFAFASELISSYQVSPDWNAGGDGLFAGPRAGLTPMLNHQASDTIPEVKAIALLLFNYSAIENIDMYGTTAYTDFKNNKENPPFKYEDMKSIYYKVEENIDTIVKCLRYFPNKPAWYQEKVLAIVNGMNEITRDKKNGVKDLETWARFANSLKLRMAMHIVKVEPETARKWAEDAVQSGVIDNVKYEISLLPSEYGGTHPLVEISETWNDLRLSASFVSLAKSLQHPYARLLFLKNTANLSDATKVNVAAETEVIGIRSGVHTGRGQEVASNQFIGFSRLNKGMIRLAPLYLFKMAEIDFLRAEGALRGWNMGGTAEAFYNRGIDNSSIFEPGTSDADRMKPLLERYKMVANAVPYTYVDPTGLSEPIESVTKIGVQWNESDSREVKLEKIITQKFIAIFPNSSEAWGERRRTGYPKMFPVLNVDEGDGSLHPGDLVRRMLFPNNDDASLKDIQETGLQALGGPDQQATRVWWDVNKENF